MNRPKHRALPLTLLCVGVSLFTFGCPKKTPPPAADLDAGAPEVVDAGVTVLEPLDEDTGVDTGPPTPPPRRGSGGGGGTNAARIRQCCSAMRKQAANMGASPEANIVIGLAAQCDMLAAQAAGGTAPEFGAFRQMISGRTLPAACSGL
jgi:hypothetical protein